MTGPPRVRVVGHHSAPSGMGQHARSVTLALAAAGVPVAAHDVYGHWPVPATFLRDLGNLRGRHGADGPPSATELDIYAVNADELPDVLARVPSGSRRLAFPHWELARFPDEWASRCAEFDGVWTASSLTQASIASAGVAGVECVGLAVAPEAPSFRTRRSFGLPEDRFLVLSAVHLASYWTRKNDPEVDLVGADKRVAPAKVAFAGSIKWRETAPFDSSDLERLIATSARVPGVGPATPLVAVSRRGIDRSARKLHLGFGPADLLAAYPTG